MSFHSHPQTQTVTVCWSSLFWSWHWLSCWNQPPITPVGLVFASDVMGLKKKNKYLRTLEPGMLGSMTVCACCCDILLKLHQKKRRHGCLCTQKYIPQTHPDLLQILGPWENRGTDESVYDSRLFCNINRIISQLTAMCRLLFCSFLCNSCLSLPYSTFKHRWLLI